MKDPRFPDIPHMGDLPLCFDFDGVLAEGTWPSPHIGKPIKDGCDALRYYALRGWEIVILTARPRSHFDRIWFWLNQRNLHWYVYDVVREKPRAAAYIDDRAVRFPFTQKGTS